MAKRKTPKHSTGQPTENRKEMKFWEYRDLYSWQMKPINIVSLERLADDLIEWVKKDTSLRINDFYDDQGIGPKDFFVFCERSEKLQQAYEYAKRKIASRRELGALTKKYDAATVFRSLSHYCDVDREQFEYRTQIAAKAKANLEMPAQQIIVLKDMPTTDKVPVKK